MWVSVNKWVCNLSLPYEFSVSVDDGWFYEFADKQLQCFMLSFNELDLLMIMTNIGMVLH